jgi:Leucine-rich repeat (LRR) protein
LPDSLETLLCDSCTLSHLPGTLPRNLMFLSCNNNNITYIPSTLPSQLTTLHCNHNIISGSLYIPSHIKSLLCSHNKIQSVYGIHDNLHFLNVYNNPLLFSKRFDSEFTYHQYMNEVIGTCRTINTAIYDELCCYV